MRMNISMPKRTYDSINETVKFMKEHGISINISRICEDAILDKLSKLAELLENMK